MEATNNIAEAAYLKNWEKVRQLVEKGYDVNAVWSITTAWSITGLHWVAVHGNAEICELLVKSGANITAKDDLGDQPLHLAALHNNVAVCELLVAHGADVTAVNKWGQNPLVIAVSSRKFNESSSVCRALITNDTVNAEDCDGNRALHFACQKYNTRTVQLLVDCGADINAVNKNGQTPLHKAAGGREDCPELCEILLKQGINMNAVDKDGNQPLHGACYSGHTRTVGELVAQGADVNALNKHGQTPLHTAAGGWKDCPELCEILLKYGASINVMDKDGNQPLHGACKQYHVKTVGVLVAQGADVNALNKRGQTPLHTAAGGDKDCPELCEILLKYGASINAMDEDGNQPLHRAYKQYHDKTMGLLICQGADVNGISNPGQTPLHTAAGGRNDCPELCEILLKYGASINAINKDRNQPLHEACNRGHIRTVGVLVAQGADVNALNKHGQTPLHIAAGLREDCPELCEILLKHRANINAMDNDGNQPLHEACKESHTRTVGVLVAQGADVHALNKRGQTPLHTAAGGWKDCPELCEILLKHGASINAMDKDGNQSLHRACKEGHTRTVGVLIAQGADVGALNKHGLTPLHKAAYGDKDCPELCEILLKHGASINAMEKDGDQPLHVTCYSGHTRTVGVLVAQGADVNALNKHGQTPLHTTAYGDKDCPELCKILLKPSETAGAEDEDVSKPCHLSGNGAEVNAVDGSGETALQVALKNKNVKTAKLCSDLLSRGVSPQVADQNGKLPLHIALNERHPQTSWLLFKQLSDPTLDDLQNLRIPKRDQSNLLYLSCCHCDVESCQKLLDLGADPNAESTMDKLPGLGLSGSYSMYPLHIAVWKKNVELCHLLLNHGATVNAAMHTRSHSSKLHLAQSLHIAVQLGCPDVCRLLIEGGALVNAEMKQEKTPLHLAITGNKEEITRLLLSHGATLENVKIGNVSALERSTKRGSQSLASLLHESNAFPDEIVRQGETALQIYLSSCDEGNAVTVFVRVDVVGRDGAGKTSLTKSLTLQEFNPFELSTTGVRWDPKCQIIVKEACDWTTPITSEHYKDLYDKNVTAIVADKLDTPEVKDQYFSLQKAKRPKRSRQGQKHGQTSVKDGNSKKKAFKSAASDSCVTGQIIDSSSVLSSEESNSLMPEYADNLQQHSNEVEGAVTVDNTILHESKLEPTQTALLSPDSSMLQDSSVVTDPCDSCVIPAPSTPIHSFSSPIAARLVNSAAVQEDNRKCNESSKRKRKIQTPILQECKVVKETKEVTTVCELLPSSQKHDQPTAQFDKYKVTRKRKKQSKSQPSVMSGNTAPSSKETEEETKWQLPEKIQKSVTKFLRNKESLEKVLKEMMITVLDYAGQHVFYATHHLCLSKAGFYYVVFNASQQLDGTTPSVFRGKNEVIDVSMFDNETNFDRLLEWMSAIHVIEPDHCHRIMLFDDIGIASPAMFLVGTHADKLKEQPGMLERQEKLLREKLEGTVLAKHIIWASKDRMCFYVDNTITNPQSGRVDPQVHLLRQKTEEVARKVAQHHTLPISWLKVEQEVREVKVSGERKTISVDDLFQKAKVSAGIKTREELEVLLHYLSNRAVLLYRPKALKSGEEKVVLDVEWLVKQLEKVVTIHAGVPPKLKNDITRTEQRGIMTSSLIKNLLSECNSDQELIISLMNHFDLLCEYAGFEAHDLHRANRERDFLSLDGTVETPSLDDIHSTKNCDYFVPCLLQKTSHLESEQTDVSLKTMPLVLSSAPLHIPRPLFYRVLIHLCKRFRRLPDLYSNVGYFHVFPGHRLEFSLNRYSFQFVILSETQMPPTSTVCACARRYIVNAVETLKQEGMAGLQLHLGFHKNATSLPLLSIVATTKKEEEEEEDFISLHGFPDQRLELYNNRKRQLLCPPDLFIWYPQLIQKSATQIVDQDQQMKSISESVSYSTPVKTLIGGTPSQCIVEMSSILDQADDMEDDWRRLWSELLNRPLKEDIVSQKEEGPTQFLLTLWCRANPPSQATVGHLIKALNAIYRNDVANLLEKFCNKAPIPCLIDNTAGSCDTSLSVGGSQNVARKAESAISPSAMPSQKRVQSLKDRLRKHYASLINQVIVEYYLNQLYAEEYFAVEDKDRLSELTGRKQKTAFIDTLMCKSDQAIQKFLDISKETNKQPQLYAEIMSEEEESNQQS